LLEAIVGLAKRLIEAGGSIVGVRYWTEEPVYTVEQVTSGLEIRYYGPRVAAETTVAADEVAARSGGFRRLAGYIFGGNHTDTKIAMTAPQRPDQDRDCGSPAAPVALRHHGAVGGSLSRCNEDKRIGFLII
jgi:SOUL heme-binding protein